MKLEIRNWKLGAHDTIIEFELKSPALHNQESDHLNLGAQYDAKMTLM